MTRLFRSKSCGLVGLAQSNNPPPPAPSTRKPQRQSDHSDSGDEEEEEDDEEEEEEQRNFGYDSEDSVFGNPISTPFINPGAREAEKHNHQFPILDILVAALRKSIVTCSVERDDVSSSSSSMDISSPTDVRHVSHVTFDRFNGFLGLPVELEPEVSRKPPSASVSVFGVSAKSMQCSYDGRGNSVPTILLMMQNRLYSEGGLKAEGIFRINAENSQEEYVRDHLNKGVVPSEIDVHCLAGLIKAWLRELPTGVLDSLTPEQVMHCNTENDCTQLVMLLPAMEAALLDWAINLMADVVQHEQFNKMNARNIAMVFAPNMTQMADPLTALIHAVQVMNFLKTLILKTLRERGESSAKSSLLSSRPNSDPSCEPHPSNSNSGEPREQSGGTQSTTVPATDQVLRTDTLDRLESDNEENFWSFKKKNDGDEDFESTSNCSTPKGCRMGGVENRYEGGYDNNGDWLSLRRGVRRLCRHPVFQLSKPTKKTRGIGIVNTRGEDREAWA